MHQCAGFRIIQRLPLGDQTNGQQTLFQKIIPLIGECGLLGLFVDCVMLFLQVRHDLVDLAVHFGPILCGARND